MYIRCLCKGGKRVTANCMHWSARLEEMEIISHHTWHVVATSEQYEDIRVSTAMVGPRLCVHWSSRNNALASGMKAEMGMKAGPSDSSRGHSLRLGPLHFELRHAAGRPAQG